MKILLALFIITPMAICYSFFGFAYDVDARVVMQRNSEVISTSGLGSLKVGMPKADLIGQIAKGNANTNSRRACDIHDVKGKDGVRVMIEEGKLTSVIVTSNKYKTVSGANVGMTAAEIRKIYGASLKRTEHTYGDAPAAYYTIRARNGSKVVFDVNDKNKVAEIRAGISAGYVEGCL